MLALDRTKLGGSSQIDMMSRSDGEYYPIATLTSIMDEMVEVYRTNNKKLTCKYKSQTAQLSNAIGLH